MEYFKWKASRQRLRLIEDDLREESKQWKGNENWIIIAHPVNLSERESFLNWIHNV